VEISLALAVALMVCSSAAAATVLYPGQSKKIGRTLVLCTTKPVAKKPGRVALHPGGHTKIRGVTITCRTRTTGPLAGDPRVCDITRPDPVEKARDCALAAAKGAARDYAASHGAPSAEASCVAGGELVFKCTVSGTPYTVTYVRGATGWRAAVTSP